jgi:hypothetical protein
MNDKNDKLMDNICRVLDASVDNLDSATQMKLGQLKYRALDVSAREGSKKFYWSAVPATLIVIFFIFLLNGTQNNQPQLLSPDFVELNLLTTGESLEFYAEDIEFYEWLSEVLENEPDLLDQRTDLSDALRPDLALGSRVGQRSASEPRTHRIFGGLRG